MPNSPNLGLLLMAASQAQKETVFNNFLIAMDALYKGSVIDVTLNTPPGSPSLGDAYVIATGGTGAWSGNDGKVAVYFNGWQFFGPANGQLLWSVTQGAYYVYKNPTLGWVQVPAVAVTALTELTDVNAGGATGGQMLVFNEGTGKWVPRAPLLSTLQDVNVTEGAPIDGWVLAWKNSDTKWEPKQLSAVATSGAFSDLTDAPAVPTNGSFDLAGLGDVQISSLADGQALIWNATACKWENGAVTIGGGGGSGTLAGDSDATISSPADGHVLTYEASSSKWKNKPTATGGGGGGTPNRYSPPDLSALTGQTNLNGATLTSRTTSVAFPSLHVKPGPTDTSGVIYCAMQAVPTGDLSAIVKVKSSFYGNIPDQIQGAGIIVRDGSTNGYLSAAFINNAAGPRVAHTLGVSGATSFNTGSADGKFSMPDEDVFLHADWNSTAKALTYSISRNGIDKVAIYTETNVSSVAYIGIGWNGAANAINTTGVNGPEFDFMHYYVGAAGTNGL